MDKKQKNMLYRIIAAGMLFAAAFLIPSKDITRLIIFLVPYAAIGYDVLFKAVKNIFRGQVFDENFLMAIASVGALVLGEYPEAVAVMLFYQVGELFQSYAVGKSRRSIAALMDIRPDYANIEREGKIKKVDPEQVSAGDIIVVKAGEKIPLDGVVAKGHSSLDMSMLTGESLPVSVYEGKEVLSGCVNLSGLIKVRVEKEFYDSTVSKILDLVEHSAAKKSRAENFITKFARYYTPIVMALAVILAVIPPLVFLGQWSQWINRALIFLVISCPCALVISVPMSFFGGIGGSSKYGVLVKGGNYLEVLAKVGVMVFDKTGTLTKGSFKVTKVEPVGMTKEELLKYAALSESYSDHPIAKSIKEEYKSADLSAVKDVTEIAGKGVRATVLEKTVQVGNEKIMEGCRGFAPSDEWGSVVYVSIDGVYAGYIVISDEIKENAKKAIKEIKQLGVSRTVMLTGDARAASEKIAAKLGIDEVHAGLLPADKVAWMDGYIERSEDKVAFVGDGINDAPVLSRADVGIAMGALGSDAAIESADIVLMDDNPLKISRAIKIARKTVGIATQNIVFALTVKGVIMVLGVFGIAGMWEAVFADVGVAVLAILNAMRTLGTRKKDTAPGQSITGDCKRE